jgi:sugar (pentulose or hexulose) kinase
MISKRIAVIDIGKTNAKFAIVDTKDFDEIAVFTMPNKVRQGPYYPFFDVAAIWTFLLDKLKYTQAKFGIDAVSVTTHGASGALISADGQLAAPILDYEHTGPENISNKYDVLRPKFAETGSPRLPAGLNLGAQIYWLCSLDSSLLDRTAHIVTYPQYWGYRLTGILACDVSSLGCHTDLWNPFSRNFSSLTDKLCIRDKIAPARQSSDILGSVLPEITKFTGIPGNTPVYCGIHDSNASLIPHLLGGHPPFSVVSTGTWVIAMTIGGRSISLDPQRDTLVNVDAFNNPVPSARFMGGREFELLLGGIEDTSIDYQTLREVAKEGPMLMPSVVTESGPFQGRQHVWIGDEPIYGEPQRMAAISYYLAMISSQCLSLTGHDGPIVVEGPFARNRGYCIMLAAAMQCKVYAASSTTGTSTGAAMLAIETDTKLATPISEEFTYEESDIFCRYAQRWYTALED